jgi:hypothetical protein
LTIRPRCRGQTDPRDNRYGIEIWTAPSAADCKASSTGGTIHALELEYDGHFAFDPITSQNGRYQILSRWNDRRGSFTAGTRFAVDLNRAPTIASTIAELGFAHAFYSDEPGTITGAAPVTAWGEAAGFGALSFGNDSTAPATTTDGDGVTCIQFVATSSLVGDHMRTANLIANTSADFVIVGVVAKTNTTADQHALTLSTTVSGKAARLSWGYGTAVDTADFFRDDGTRCIANSNGLGGHTFTASNAKHFFVLMRRTELDGVTYLYESLDGGIFSKSAITNSTFSTATVVTTIGSGYAPGGGVPYLHFGGRYYALASNARGMSWAELEAVRDNHKTRFVF